MRKLTKSEIGSVCFLGTFTTVWSRIEEDREAIREETRAEVLKDHFSFGETVIVESYLRKVKCRFYPTFQHPSGTNDWFVAEDLLIRRPEMRPMTREEKIKALRDTHGKSSSVEALVLNWEEDLADATLDNLLKICEIPTEVPE